MFRTDRLIRKRAEHNDGVLPDLEELSLHQEELEKIESLEQCCRFSRSFLDQKDRWMVFFTVLLVALLICVESVVQLFRP